MVVETSWIGESDKEKMWVVVALRTKEEESERAEEPHSMWTSLQSIWKKSTSRQESRQSIECSKQSPQSMDYIELLASTIQLYNNIVNACPARSSFNNVYSLYKDISNVRKIYYIKVTKLNFDTIINYE